MTPYKNLNGDSGVAAFENEATSITVQFNDGSTYLYTYASAGATNVEEMKRHATEGRGLNTFINRQVKKQFERRIQ